jgi:hypothetical protein
MKMSEEQVLDRSEEIITKANTRGLATGRERADFNLFGLTNQLEDCLYTNLKTNQREVLLLIKELYILSAKMGNPIAKERLKTQKYSQI